jgi:hypothetical protein
LLVVFLINSVAHCIRNERFSMATIPNFSSTTIHQNLYDNINNSAFVPSLCQMQLFADGLLSSRTKKNTRSRLLWSKTFFVLVRRPSVCQTILLADIYIYIYIYLCLCRLCVVCPSRCWQHSRLLFSTLLSVTARACGIFSLISTLVGYTLNSLTFCFATPKSCFVSMCRNTRRSSFHRFYS